MQAAGNVKAATTEAELRVQLAAAYRMIAHFGWDDGIQNHLTCRIPGTDDQYLINSYGTKKSHTFVQ
jgi:ribulose-5-phosphate 4-epimerase/fuculose-1-phosphate aldolase